MRGFASRALEEHGYTVLEAAGGADALAIAASQAGPIALLVTDVIMPGAAGPSARRAAHGGPARAARPLRLGVHRELGHPSWGAGPRGGLLAEAVRAPTRCRPRPCGGFSTGRRDDRAGPTARGGRGTVLVVDDAARGARALRAGALRDAGYDTLEAADGVEALEAARAPGVALVLLDSTMPRLDGAGVIRAVREREATRTLPVILVTAKADLDDRVAGARGRGRRTTSPNRSCSTSSWPASAPSCAGHAAWTQAVERGPRIVAG